MNREVCLFDKFSYCKNGVKCLRIHLKEVCWNRDCDYRKCNKRHPRPCKIFLDKGFCRFGTSCRYSHRPPKVIEEQNKKIDSLENRTAKLLKQVTDQDAIIKDLKKKLLERECNEIKCLQKQINDLVQKNDEKERAIKNLETEFNNIKDNCLITDDQDDVDEEEIELNETSMSPVQKTKSKVEKKHPVYVETHLQYVKDLGKEVKKLCGKSKYARDVLKLYRGKFEVYWFGLDPEPDYYKAVGEFNNFLKGGSRIDKGACLSKINDFKRKLESITIITVSYTHLTLPTILLV